jgi:hypothetical protein
MMTNGESCAAEPVHQRLGRPELAFTEPGVALAGHGWGWGEWSDLDGGFSMGFWDACELLAETGVRLAHGVLGPVLSVLRNAAAPRVVDRRVTVNLENVTVSAGAICVLNCPTGEHPSINYFENGASQPGALKQGSAKPGSDEPDGRNA